MAINFAPYSSPPSSPTLPTSRLLPSRQGPSSSSSSSRTGGASGSRSSWLSGAKSVVRNPFAGGSTPWMGSGNNNAQPSRPPVKEQPSYQGGEDFDDYEARFGSAGGIGNSSTRGGVGSGSGGMTGSTGFGSGGTGPEDWETRWGWRLDLMSAAAYGGSVLTALPLLMLETHSSYVRFHAYQSLLLDCFILVLHVLCLFLFPTWLQWLLFVADLGAVGGMTFRAYQDANRLDRFRLPYIGNLADEWVEAE